MPERWYVVQSKPNEEIRAHVGLAAQGFETFYPRHRVEISHARKRSIELRPLYPTYLFVRFDVEDRGRWVPIVSTRGVFTIIGLQHADLTPLPVPEGVVEWLRGWVRQVDEVFERGPEKPRKLPRGTAVQIEHGAYSAYQRQYGVDALVDWDNGKRVKVLLDILGKKRPIHLPRDSVTPKS